MVKTIPVGCISFALMALVSLSSHAQSLAGGTIGFMGGIVVPTQAGQVGPDLQSFPVAGAHSAVYSRPLGEAKAELSLPLLDYFDGYADEAAALVTAVHH